MSRSPSKLSAILVHYHAAELAREAITAVDRDAARSGLEVEWWVVDNGSTPTERERLATLPGHLLEPGENLGYAGAINLAARQATGGELLLMNPDVLVLPGCLEALHASLAGGAAVAGPKLFWDHGRIFLLPPNELRRRGNELLTALATRGAPWAAWARRRWRRHAHRHWLASQPLASFALSGALLAIDRRAWEQVGPFDEGFQLYFEESDWLARAERAGLAGQYVPQAEAVHLYAQSASHEPRSQAWFEASARRFRRRYYGAAFTTLLERLARPPSPTVAAVHALPTSGPAWLEVAASPLGFPAAARPPAVAGSAPEEGLPREVWERLAPGTYTLRWVETSGRELAARELAKPTPKS